MDMRWVRGAVRDGLAKVTPSILKTVLLLRNRRGRGDRELALLPALVEADQQAVDVGANRGVYSAALERLVGPERLHIFEPVPELHQFLCRLFRRAHVHRVALSNRSGTSELSVPLVHGRAVQSRATLTSGIEEPGETGRQSFTVTTARLDDYLDRGDLRDVGFLKIDVEGHELQVLQGAARLLRTCHPILLVEIEQRHHVSDMSHVVDCLRDAGYELYYLNPRGWDLISVRHFAAARDQDPNRATTRHYVNNFFCFPRQRADALLAQVSGAGRGSADSGSGT